MIKNIGFDKIKNARDFSYLTNKEGKKIKKGSFIRSSQLSKATDRDVKILTQEYNLKTIIDLRTNLEKEEKPDRVPEGVKLVETPLFTEATMGVTKEKSLEGREMLKKLPDMCDLYRTIVTDDYCSSKLREEFQVIKNHREGTLLWHCTEGKDRCGITSALFLSILDFDREDILKDYEFTTNVSIKKANKLWFVVTFLLWQPKKANLVREMYKANRKFLMAAFDAIEEKCGSVDAYIRDVLNISDKEREEFKSAFLE